MSTKKIPSGIVQFEKPPASTSYHLLLSNNYKEQQQAVLQEAVSIILARNPSIDLAGLRYELLRCGILCSETQAQAFFPGSEPRYEPKVETR